jgi:hypothetical protein
VSKAARISRLTLARRGFDMDHLSNIVNLLLLLVHGAISGIFPGVS